MLGQCCLTKEETAMGALIIEKPFGHDLESGEEAIKS